MLRNSPLLGRLLYACAKCGTPGRRAIRIYSTRDAHHSVPCGSLAGKTAIITGASSGIGEAISRALSTAGVRVGLGARRLDKLEMLQAQIEQNGGKAMTVRTDVTKRDEVQNLVLRTEAKFGPIDILINNAGVMYYTLMRNQHVDEWEQTVDVNCKGTMYGIGAVLDGMLKRGQGHIVNITSDAGRQGFAGLAVYTGSKFFIEGMSQALRAEIGTTGVRVTCIQPGDVTTDLAQRNTDKEAQTQYDMSRKRRSLDPDDVARAVLYALTQPSHVAVNEILVQPSTLPT